MITEAIIITTEEIAEDSGPEVDSEVNSEVISAAGLEETLISEVDTKGLHIEEVTINMRIAELNIQEVVSKKKEETRVTRIQIDIEDQTEVGSSVEDLEVAEVGIKTAIRETLMTIKLRKLPKILQTVKKTRNKSMKMVKNKTKEGILEADIEEDRETIAGVVDSVDIMTVQKEVIPSTETTIMMMEMAQRMKMEIPKDLRKDTIRTMEKVVKELTDLNNIDLTQITDLKILKAR
jgi:hypothetical protein